MRYAILRCSFSCHASISRSPQCIVDSCVCVCVCVFVCVYVYTCVCLCVCVTLAAVVVSSGACSPEPTRPPSESSREGLANTSRVSGGDSTSYITYIYTHTHTVTYARSLSLSLTHTHTHIPSAGSCWLTQGTSANARVQGSLFQILKSQRPSIFLHITMHSHCVIVFF